MLKYILAFLVIAGIWTAWAIFLFSVDAWDMPTWIPIVVSVLTILILATIVLVRIIRARRAASQLEKALAEQAAQHARSARPDKQAEIMEVQKEFENALGALKSSKLGKNALYALPWQIIIGPPGAGKTTALRKSGLDFPYQSKGSIKGIGGTRNCDWWLTNEAVILDTAGRWTSEDEDRNEWLGFLDLLKKFRPHKPLNGIIVAISVSDLGGASEDEAVGYAQKIRERIDEAQDRLQMSLPVYVLFTKCDLIPGFVETFGDLSKNDRNQLWGFTVPLTKPVDPEDHFAEKFDELMGALEKWQIRRMGDERKLETREMIYLFPKQLEVLKTNLRAFVGKVFEENVFHETPAFRGVYLTSGTQEGRPIDRVMNKMAEAFGIQSALPIAQVKEPKSYFIGDLFRSIIFKDADVAVRSAAEIRRQRRLRYIIAAVVLVIALLLLTFPIFSYFNNRGILADTGGVVTQFEENVAQSPARTPLGPAALAPIKQQVNTLDDQSLWHPSASWGMYQGNEVREPLTNFYHKNALRDQVAKVLFDDLSEELQLFDNEYRSKIDGPPLREYQSNHDRLRDYLLLSVPAETKQPPLSDKQLRSELVDDLTKRWAAKLEIPAEGATFEAMRGHITDYIDAVRSDSGLAFRRDKALVDTTRLVLNRADTTKLALQGMIEEFSPPRFRDVTLYDLIGTANESWIKASVNPATREPWAVPAVYTRDIWDLYIAKRLADETPLGEVLPWVVGNESVQDTKQAREKMREDVREQYFEAYSNAWWDFHRNLYTITPSTDETTYELLTALTAGGETPLHRLYKGFNDNLTLPEPEPDEVDTSDAESGMLDAVAREARRKLVKGAAGRILDKGVRGIRRDPRTGKILAEPWSAVKVYRTMEPFILFGYIPPVAPVGDQPPPAPAKTQLDSYEEELGFLRKSYSDYRDDNSASKALSDQLQQARTNVDLMINRQDVRFKVAFDQLLRPPIKGASNAYSKTLAKGAGLSWCAAVVEPHDTTIDARYPFERTGHDMSFDDFAAFYAPTGTLWTFYDEVLKTYIRREGNDFEWNRRLGKSQGSVFAPNLQQFLERSYDITHVFFPTGAESPRVDFDLRVRPHPRVAIQQVTIGGKMIEYHNGPEEWHRFSWPGEEDPGQGALLEVRGADGMHERIEQEGEWGLFHLIEEGTVLSGSGRGFTIVWHLRTHDVDITIDFRPVREDTPFFGVVGRSRSPRLLQPMRNTNLDPPRDITIGGALTCPRRPTTVAVNAPRGM